MTSPAKLYAAHLALAVLISLSLPLLLVGFSGLKEAIFGALIVAGNGVAACVINTRSLRGNSGKFFFWALLMNGLRILVLIIVILSVYQLASLAFKPFLTATLSGYFVFLFGEIHTVVITSREGQKEDNE